MSNMRFTVTKVTFEVTMWTLCGLSALFLPSRFAIRTWKKGRLWKSDYFLVLALPSLFAAAILLQLTLDDLYLYWPTNALRNPQPLDSHLGVAPRLSSAIVLLWIAIYCVKASFFAQFKFHKSPYAYISPLLTRYYWTAIFLCGLAFLLTFIIPIVLCPNSGNCRYFRKDSTFTWEIVLTTVDLMTDLLVISIPVLLIWMANFTLTRAFINTFFKSLSIFMMAIAACRLGLQETGIGHEINYVTLTFCLVVEASVAVIMASISTYRVLLLDYLAKHKTHQDAKFMQAKGRNWSSLRKLRGPNHAAKIANPHPRMRLESQSDISAHKFAQTTPTT